MNLEGLRGSSVAYLIFLALCIPVALGIGGPIQGFCAGAILFFFPGYFMSLCVLGEQSVAGRIGTAIGFSFVLLAILEVAYTTLSIPGSPLSILGPLFVWTTLMFISSLALKREEVGFNVGALLKAENLVILAMLIFGMITRLWYPLSVGTIPFFDPLYWATRAAYFVHTGFTGIPAFLAGGSSDWIRERSFEFTTGSFAMIGDVSVVDTAVWFGPIVGIFASVMLLAVLERLGVSLAGKVVGLFFFGSMSPLFEVFWRTNITIMQVVGTYALFLGLYLCASREVGCFLSGTFVLGISMDLHILYGIYTPFIFVFVVLVHLLKRQDALMAFASVSTYAVGLMLFAWRFLERGVPAGFTPGLITNIGVPFAMQAVLPLLALQLVYPDPTYILLYVTPLVAALAIVGLAGSLIETNEWGLPRLVLLAFVLGIFAGWVLSTLYFSFDAATAEIFRGRGVAYAQAVLIPAAALGVTTIERWLSRRSALISPGRVVAVMVVLLIIFTNVSAAASASKYQSVISQDDFNAIRFVGAIPRSDTRLAFFAHPNPADPYENASSSQRNALFYVANPSAFDASPTAYRDEVSNSTAALQLALQSDKGVYNYVILSANLGFNDRAALDSYLTSNGYTAIKSFGNAFVYRSGT
ncbi:MAG TPA: hypothetical protein VEB88_01510 [Candidatus Acidoferrales bacterium]|nr:hypothetical protein [Candidatus Acidoferrales bacterium]